MKDPKSLLVLIAAALGYYLGLVFAIGVAARLLPLPSLGPAVPVLAHALAVMAVAALIAPVLLARFGTQAFVPGLLAAAPCTLDLLWSLSQSDIALKAPLQVGKDVLLIALAPAAMTVVISRLLKTVGRAQVHPLG